MTISMAIVVIFSFFREKFQSPSKAFLSSALYGRCQRGIGHGGVQQIRFPAKF